jgi:uncharacterized membrane protein
MVIFVPLVFSYSFKMNKADAAHGVPEGTN